MARRGRPPDPTPLKVLKGRGNGKDQAGRPIPKVPSFDRGAPDVPELLDDEARAEWERVAPSLDRLDLLKPEDRAALATYCNTWSVYVASVRTYQRDGMTKTSPQGNITLHPAMRVMNASSATLLRFMQEFGLTPAAEIRLAKPVTPDDSEDDAYGATGTS